MSQQQSRTGIEVVEQQLQHQETLETAPPVVVMNGTGDTINMANVPSSATNGGDVFPSSSLDEIVAELSIGKSSEKLSKKYPVTSYELGEVSSERTLYALATLLKNSMEKQKEGDTCTASETNGEQNDHHDVEAPCISLRLRNEVLEFVESIRQSSPSPNDTNHHHHLDGLDEHSPEFIRIVRNADMMANLLTRVVLLSSPENGLDSSEVESRRKTFGSNAMTDKELDSFLKLCYEAVQDFVLIMLIVLGVIGIAVEIARVEPGEKCGVCWIEGAAILCSVAIVVYLTALIDYMKQFAFIRLNKSLNDTNTKSVLRDGKLINVTDEEIVVGDILTVNSHNMASIPADCLLLGPANGELKMDESALTGESEPVIKHAGDVILSGTNAVEGSGKMVVIAVGIFSVAGKIRARVYSSTAAVENAENSNNEYNQVETGEEDADRNDNDDLEGDDVNSPLFVKLESLATRIGIAGTFASLIAFIGLCVLGFSPWFGEKEKFSEIINYLMQGITVLAVAVPEGLPLAVTLALAFSSNKMMSEQNLVKHLDACETMGCATTICTDKTGTLTANKMTARAIFTGGVNYVVDDPAETLGSYVSSSSRAPSHELIDETCKTIAIDTMNESVCEFGKNGLITKSAGNPTEVALLSLVHSLGRQYQEIRDSTRGRAEQGALAGYCSDGKQYNFTSARKMMSWAVPSLDSGGYRVYCKGASEVVLSRCTKYLDLSGQPIDMSQEQTAEFQDISLSYARRGMRCLLLAYRDLESGFHLDSLRTDIVNSDGSPAYQAESDLTAVALIGIEDPLRPEVPGAISKCYRAGIDVRLVTGDSRNTAVSIAYQAGILRDFHFKDGTTERVAENLKNNVLMEGKEFRRKVYTGEGAAKEFSQEEFDKIWPYLRVLARSSPDDKLSLAHGLNQSNLFADRQVCKKLEDESGIKIFPDRQVVAMTGDGTNDAPALKRADIGFAMGISGTQIAKDAADIILIDDNFASIVTAVKWGRNVYASIQKFLQFQLTVNIAAVVSALVGVFVRGKSPLAAIQLLWVNLLMDSLASLALASEPPVEQLLEKPPVNRTQSMITKHMWANMLGQSAYQIAVVMTLLFAGPDIFDIEEGYEYEKRTNDNSLHYTIIFNAFVWMQLFNEVNCRNLKGELNVFKGILNNPIFCTILLVTGYLQFIIVQFGSLAFHVVEGGLVFKYWLLCMVLGFGSLPVQQLINAIFRISQHFNFRRSKARLDRDRHNSMRLIDSNGLHEHED